MHDILVTQVVLVAGNSGVVVTRVLTTRTYTTLADHKDHN